MGRIDAPPRYTSRDCFQTFPLPGQSQSDEFLKVCGEHYHDHRAALMVTRHEGLTRTYNRFHNPSERSTDIQRLRELQHALDLAVLRAYGWDDLAGRALSEHLADEAEPDHRYKGRLFWPVPFRDEVLARLLALNADRAAAERAAGLAPVAPDPDDAEAEAAA